MDKHVALESKTDMLRAHLTMTPPPLTLAQLLLLYCVYLGNDKTTKDKPIRENMGVLGAKMSYSHYIEGMRLGFHLDEEQAVEVAQKWGKQDIAPKKHATLRELREHVDGVVLPMIADLCDAARAEATGEDAVPVVLGFGVWSDGLLAADFESAALRARMNATIQSHAGTNVVRVRFTGTPVEFIFGVYAHPGSSGSGADDARAPLYGTWLRRVLTRTSIRTIEVPCPSALRDRFGLPPADEIYHDDDDVVADDSDDEEL